MDLFRKLKKDGFLIESKKISQIYDLKPFIYLGSSQGMYQEDYYFYHDKLSVVRVYGCADLKRKMSGIRVGTQIRIGYMGLVNNSHKVFILKIDEQKNLKELLMEDLCS